MSDYHRGLAQVIELQRGLVPVIECQTSHPSWLAHMEWADRWMSATNEQWGCAWCGTRTFHAANVARAEATNEAIYAASGAVWTATR